MNWYKSASPFSFNHWLKPGGSTQTTEEIWEDVNPLGYPKLYANERGIHYLQQLLNNREPEVRRLADELKNTFQDLFILDRTKGGGPEVKQLEDKIYQLQKQLDIPAGDRLLGAETPYEETTEYKNYLKNQERRLENCNIKVIAVSQFVAAQNQEFYSQSFQQLADQFSFRWVCENESPSIGTVWFKEDDNTGKAFIWKHNYDSSD